MKQMRKRITKKLRRNSLCSHRLLSDPPKVILYCESEVLVIKRKDGSELININKTEQAESRFIVFFKTTCFITVSCQVSWNLTN